MTNRRNFLRNSAIGALAAISLPEIISNLPSEGKRIKLTKGSTILFQGDSITDAGRNKEDQSFNTTRVLGTGYAMLASAELLEEFATLNLRIYNKGISGNKVYQLAERWDKDCIDLKPDLLSILIGVNDYWHKKTGNYNGTIEVYRNDYSALIERTLKALPDIKLIICEPFAIPDVKAVDKTWFPEFGEYQAASKEIAIKYGALFIPFQKIFNEAIERVQADYWTSDGVHTTFAGSQLMAEAWLEALKLS